MNLRSLSGRVYGGLNEAVPPNAPEESGKEVYVRRYVDSNHAGEKKTMMSRSGFFVLLNTALT